MLILNDDLEYLKTFNAMTRDIVSVIS